MSWPSVSLGDVCTFQGGYAFPSKRFNRSGEGTPVIRIQNVGAGGLDDFVYWSEPYDERYLITQDDLLLSLSGSFRVVAWQGADALLNQRIVKLTPNAGLQPSWLLRNLESQLRRIEAMGRHALVNNVSMKDLRLLKIPFPPLAEQKRIAAILDKADAIRRKRQEAIALTEEFLRSAYIDMVGPGHPDYESWPEVEMKTLALEGKGNMRTGPFGSALKHSEFVDEGIAVLGIDNAVQNRFAWSQRRFITPAKYEGLKHYTVRPNDVIVTIMGTTGRSAVVPADIPLAITTKHLATITVDSRKAVPEYVSNAVHRDPVVLHQIAMRNRGAVMPGLNLGIIKELKVRLPPLSQQQLFDTALKEARQLERRLQSNNDTSNNLFNSLVQRAFRGEL